LYYGDQNCSRSQLFSKRISLISKNLQLCARYGEREQHYYAGVGSLTKEKRACAVTVALAEALNDELTVIMSNVSLLMNAIEPEHPARESLIELNRASLRCARRSAEALDFIERQGVRPARASWAALTDWESAALL
jgi:hypothetical protein